MTFQFEEELRTAARTATRLCARRRLPLEDTEDFRSYVMVKLIENDCARLRKYEGRSSFGTYIQVVIQRLYVDYFIQQWGKWHPTARAKELGATAVRLERLVYREGFSFVEACSLMRHNSEPHATREQLWDIYVQLPVRPRRRSVGIEVLDRSGPRTSLDTAPSTERRRLGRELQTELSTVLMALETTDRTILKMRYQDQVSVQQIATHFGTDFKRMSSRLRKTLRALRTRLLAKGIGSDDVRDVLDWPHHELDLDVLFGSVAVDAVGHSRLKTVRRAVQRTLINELPRGKRPTGPSEGWKRTSHARASSRLRGSLAVPADSKPRRCESFWTSSPVVR